VAKRPSRPDCTITLLLTNGETKSLDVGPDLTRGIFRELRDLRNFNSVKPLFGSIQWQNGQDLGLDALSADSVPVLHGVGASHLQAYLDERCYRLNRQGKREDVFRRLLNRCVPHGTAATYSHLLTGT
jgi:hypothetical protein